MMRDTPPVQQAPEQLRYAQWLEWGTRLGLVALVLLFAAYVLGLAPAQVPVQRLPQLWNLPVGQYLQASGGTAGWSWLSRLHQGDVANLAGIALLAGCSVPCLLALVPQAARRGDRLFLGLCVAEAAVVLLAASGVIGGGH